MFFYMNPKRVQRQRGMYEPLVPFSFVNSLSPMAASSSFVE